jgi:hypothetical protein
MMGLKCRFDRAQHEVLRSGVARTIGRVAPKRVRGYLFLYLHKREGNYVVGLWHKKGKIFEDVLNLGRRLPVGYQVSRDVARMFEWNPVPLWKEMREVQSQRVHKQQDESDAQSDDWEWRRRKNRDPKCRVALKK